MDRVALIIGGASGIGAAACERIAADGARVMVADLAGDAASAVASALPGEGHEGFAIDVASEASVKDLFERIEVAHGPIAIMVNSAGLPGFVEGRRPALIATELEHWDRVFRVNAYGAFLSVREMMRRRTQRSVAHGRIILVGSMSAHDGGKNSPPAYTASKGAVHALVKAAMNEAAAIGLTINCVAPGLVDTPMLRAIVPAERHADAFAAMPMKRAGTPAEIASAIAYLATPASDFVTGACIDVNGGVRMN